MPPRKSKIPSALRDRIRDFRRIPARDLQANTANWRQHPQFQQDALAGVLKEVGIAGALLVYESQRQGGLCILDGHLRQALTPEQEWPCLVLDVDDAEADYLLSVVDPLSALATADKDRLASLLQHVQSGEAAVQAMLTELAEQEGIVPPVTAGGAVVDPELEGDRLEGVLERWQVQLGDLWYCGQHRISCADCREPSTLSRLLGDVSPAMVFADPPYGISIVATNGYVGGGEAYDIPFGGVKHPRRRIHVGGGQRKKDQTGHYPIETWRKPARGSIGASHTVEVGKYAPIIGDATTDTAVASSHLLLSLYPEAVHVWWGGNYYADVLPSSSCWLVWDKETTGNFADCELAWTNQPKASRLFHHRWNGMLRDSERERRWHPTQKPAALAAWVYDTLGTVGDVVLDPFLGSGPTLLAGEQRGRRVFGCELSQEYVAIALERWHILTGEMPLRQ